MKLSVEFPSVSYREGPEAVPRLARAIEEIGYDHIDIFDHVVMGHPDRRAPRGPLQPRHADPRGADTLGYIAAVTSRVTLGTEVLVLPQREPDPGGQAGEHARYAVGRADAARRRRGLAGVGVRGPRRGLPDARRADGRGHPAAPRVLERRGGDFTGAHYPAVAMAMEPKPPQGGRLPIWIGGYSEAAFRRVGRAGRRLGGEPGQRRGERAAGHRGDPPPRRGGRARSRSHRAPEHGGPPPRDAAGKQFYAEHDRVVARAAELKAMGFGWVVAERHRDLPGRRAARRGDDRRAGRAAHRLRAEVG